MWQLWGSHLNAQQVLYCSFFGLKREIYFNVNVGEHLAWQRLNAMFCTRALILYVEVTDGPEHRLQIHLWWRRPTVVRFGRSRRKVLRKSYCSVLILTLSVFSGIFYLLPTHIKKCHCLMPRVDRNMCCHTQILLPSMTRWQKMDADLLDSSAPVCHRFILFTSTKDLAKMFLSFQSNFPLKYLKISFLLNSSTSLQCSLVGFWQATDCHGIPICLASFKHWLLILPPKIGLAPHSPPFLNAHLPGLWICPLAWPLWTSLTTRGVNSLPLLIKRKTEKNIL